MIILMAVQRKSGNLLKVSRKFKENVFSVQHINNFFLKQSEVGVNISFASLFYHAQFLISRKKNMVFYLIHKL